MRFRPCIDLHDGKVKQIVGATLRDTGQVQTNFVSERPPSYFAELYYGDQLHGGHVIMLGKGNEEAAKEALGCHPGNLQVGGGITPENAKQWLGAGAGKVIVTSYLFVDGELDYSRLAEMTSAVGRENLVIDLSCAPVDGVYHVACNRWQTICKYSLSEKSLSELAEYCSEFLVHAVQVEGRQSGIDSELVRLLAAWSQVDVTYAGGIATEEDIQELGAAGDWRVDFTVGSALDIFGGKGFCYSELARKRSWTKPE